MMNSGTTAGSITFTSRAYKDHVRRAILVKLHLEGYEFYSTEKRELFEKMSGLDWKNPLERNSQ